MGFIGVCLGERDLNYLRQQLFCSLKNALENLKGTRKKEFFGPKI